MIRAFSSVFTKTVLELIAHTRSSSDWEVAARIFVVASFYLDVSNPPSMDFYLT